MTETHESKSTSRRRSFLLILRILLTLVILAVILLRVDLRAMGDAFQAMDAGIVLLAVLLLPVNLLLQILRWRFILATAGIQAPLIDISRSLLVGLTFGLITPGRIGEVGRSLCIRSAGAIPVAGLILLEKTFSLFTVLLTSAVSIMLWGKTLIGLALIATALFLAVHLNLIRALLSRLSFLLPYGTTVAELWTKWTSFHRQQIASLLAITLLFFGIVYLQLFLLISAFEPVTVRAALISMPLIIAINSIPLTIAGLGLREGAAVFFLSRFGVAQASALNGALLLFTLDLLLPGLAGLLLIPGSRIWARAPGGEEPR